MTSRMEDEYICIEHNSPACNECVKNFQKVEADLKAKLAEAEKAIQSEEWLNGQLLSQRFELEAKNAALGRENERLLGALERYGWHEKNCLAGIAFENDCSCGLRAARRERPAPSDQSSKMTGEKPEKPIDENTCDVCGQYLEKNEFHYHG